MDNTANDLVSTTTIADFNSQGGYNLCLALSPTNASNIIVGGVRGYRSTDGGATFAVRLNPYNDPPGVGFYVHPDFHHFSFYPDGDTVLSGHDGGIHRGSFSGAANTWIDLSPGLNITQSYHIAVTQDSSGDDFMMGNQDNDGFSKVLKNGVGQWVSAAAGDGTGVGIDYNTPSTRYLGGVGGVLYRTSDGYASSAFSATRILAGDGSAAFVSPMAIHPTVSTTIYAADSDIKISTDRGDNFTALNSGLVRTEFLDVTTNGSSIRIYGIGTTARRSDDNGATWNAVTAPTGATFNSFAAVPNSTTVFATVSGYTAGSKVYRSTDNGVTWTNMSDGLPNIVVKKVIFKIDSTNETLFLGTELGVYWKNDTMTDWEKLGTGLPNVIIDDLEINYTDQLLYVGTFGRGMWRHNISDSTLGTEDEEFKNAVNLSLFPNPVVDNQFNIKISDSFNRENLSYTIYNYVGGIVKEGNITENIQKITTENIASGIYLIRITNGKSSINKKIIIK